MTGSSSRSAIFALLASEPLRSDAVHSRVAAAHPRTHSEELQTMPAANPQTAQSTTHPGDILYWTACLGGACLLLLCATR